MKQAFVFEKFGGGINNNVPANQIADNQLVDALNVELDRQSNLRARQGVVKVNSNRNVLTRTEEFDHANWIVNGGIVVTPNTDIAPDNTLTADTLDDIDTTLAGKIQQEGSILNNEFWVASVFIKKFVGVPTNYPGIDLSYSAGGTSINAGVTVDHVNGVLLDKVGVQSLFSKSIEDFGSYWRVIIVFQNNATGNTFLSFLVRPAVASTFSGTWVGSVQGLNVFWGAQLERGKKASTYHKNVSTAAVAVNQYLTSKITSVYQYIKEDGTSDVICTSGAKAYRLDTGNDWLVPIDSAVTLPNDTYWQWVTYKDVAIGVNRSNTGAAKTNPVKLTTVGGNLAALGGSPPKGRFIEVWNNRIWIVSEDDPSVIKCSALGAIEDWSTTGKAGAQSYDIGLEVKAIKAFRDRLFLFTENSIHYIRPGSPNTDIEQYEISILSSKVGCVSAYSIQPILDDLIFLSRFGSVSLASVEQFGDFESAILSQNIIELSRELTLRFDNSASAIVPEKSQYLISLPLSGSNQHTRTYVLDFTNIQEKAIGFTRFDGLMIGACFGEILLDGKKRIYIGGYPDVDDENNVFLYKSDEPNIFNDDGVLYNKQVITKAYNLDAITSNKIFHRILGVISLLTDSVVLKLYYRLNELEEFKKSWDISLDTDVVIGAIFDDIYNFDEVNSIFSISSSPTKTFQRRIIGSIGRIGQSIQFIFENNVIDEGFVLKGFSFEVTPITSRRLRE